MTVTRSWYFSLSVFFFIFQQRKKLSAHTNTVCLSHATKRCLLLWWNVFRIYFYFFFFLVLLFARCFVVNIDGLHGDCCCCCCRFAEIFSVKFRFSSEIYKSLIVDGASCSLLNALHSVAAHLRHSFFSFRTGQWFCTETAFSSLFLLLLFKLCECVCVSVLSQNENRKIIVCSLFWVLNICGLEWIGRPIPVRIFKILIQMMCDS